VLSGEYSAMKNCVCCNRELATLLGEVALQLIALLSPFDCTQHPVCAVKFARAGLREQEIRRTGIPRAERRPVVQAK
jgi:hypothetical protein